MSAVLLAVAVLAGLACPAHMLWRARRGRHSGCITAPADTDEASMVATRQRSLAEQVASLNAGGTPLRS